MCIRNPDSGRISLLCNVICSCVFLVLRILLLMDISTDITEPYFSSNNRTELTYFSYRQTLLCTTIFYCLHYLHFKYYLQDLHYLYYQYHFNYLVGWRTSLMHSHLLSIIYIYQQEVKVIYWDKNVFLKKT